MLWRRRLKKTKAFGKAKKREKTDENGGTGHDSTVSVSLGIKVELGLVKFWPRELGFVYPRKGLALMDVI